MSHFCRTFGDFVCAKKYYGNLFYVKDPFSENVVSFAIQQKSRWLLVLFVMGEPSPNPSPSHDKITFFLMENLKVKEATRQTKLKGSAFRDD